MCVWQLWQTIYINDCKPVDHTHVHINPLVENKVKQTYKAPEKCIKSRD